MGVADVTSENWDGEVLQAKGLVVVEFWHEGCVWCKHLDPLLRELDQEYGGKVRFARFDILASEKHWEIAASFRVSGSPTLVFFCNGNPVGELLGFRPKQALKGAVEESLEKCNINSGLCIA